MSPGGNHPDSDGQLAGRVGDAIKQLRRLDRRIDGVDETLRTSKDQLGRLNGGLKDARERLDRLERNQKALRDAERKRADQQAALEEGLRGAAVQTAEVQQEIDTIDQVLPSRHPSRPPAFSELKVATLFPPFNPTTMGPAEPVLTLMPDPQPPKFSIFGGAKRYEREKEEVGEGNAALRADHTRRHASWRQAMDRERSRYDSDIATQQAAAERHNAVVDEKCEQFAAGDPDAISWFVGQTLARSQYPAWYPYHDRRYKVVCWPDRHDILIELELPPTRVIPIVQGYQYLAGQAERLALPRPRNEVSQQYQRLIAAIALRTMSEAVAATAAHSETVRAVTLNGRVQGIDAATGHAARPHLLSVSASREVLNQLKLAQVQPEACLGRLGARISSDPLALQPIEPLETYPSGSA
jgi:restriction system protein